MNLRWTAVVGFGLAVLIAVPQPQARADKPARKSEEVFGYGAAFDEALKKIGQISPADFARRYPSRAAYLDKLTWDPTTGKFFDQFQQTPAPKGKKGGAYGFHLNEAELAAFKKNGFVVSERMGAATFSEMLYRIYSRDLPVYVAPDAILQAWHRSYDAMLEELEETYLADALGEILSGMAAALPAAREAYGDGVLADGVKDADFFLAVARSLLAGKALPTCLDQDDRVWETLGAISKLELEWRFNLFGRDRVVDFSQFKVRGHYENSELLKRYFKAMMWCGRIDLRVAGNPEESSVRELAAAVVLHDLLRRAGRFEQWQQFDRMLQTFVGKTDSMTFAHLGAVLNQGGIPAAADVKDLAGLEKLQKDIVAGKIGVQQIRGHVYFSPLGPEKTRLPNSFTVLGQKFVLDSWVTAKTVYGEVLWDGEKVPHRIPSCLDVAFAALGNDQVVPLLTERMTQHDGRKFRDGLNYQHNLAAARDVIDAQVPSAWDENLYMLWLATLRELSSPTTEAKYPEVMRTKAWAMRTLNSQLGSWAQLRHDTILYAKQSYTEGTLCYYPAGFVEPRPGFWARFEKMADRAAELIEKTPFPDRVVEKPVGPKGEHKLNLSLKATQAAQAQHFRNFARQVAVLRGIAEKELAQKELTKEETAFLEKTVEIRFRGSGGPQYTGWYFGLFYKGPTDADKWDALVADVHTDPPDMVYDDPGCVLTQGVGNVDLMLVAIDSGKDRVVYAGPVFSHYEFEMPGVTRKADSEWRKDLKEGRQPPRPPWTEGYLAPGTNPNAKNYLHPNDK
jgi:hypothetical protein